jgi:hypothetical protein
MPVNAWPPQLPPSRVSWRGVPPMLLLAFALSAVSRVVWDYSLAIRAHEGSGWTGVLAALSSFALAVTLLRALGTFELARRCSPAVSGAVRFAGVCALVVVALNFLVPFLMMSMSLSGFAVMQLQRWAGFLVDLAATICFISAVDPQRRSRMTLFIVLALVTSQPPLLDDLVRSLLEAVHTGLAIHFSTLLSVIHVASIAMLTTAIAEPPVADVPTTARALPGVGRSLRVMMIALAIYAAMLGIVAASRASELFDVATMGELVILLGLLVWLAIAIARVARGALPDLSAWRISIAGFLVLWAAGAIFGIVGQRARDASMLFWLAPVLLAGLFVFVGELTAYASRGGVTEVRSEGRGAMLAIAMLIIAVVARHLWQPDVELATRARAFAVLFDAVATLVACWLTGRVCRVAVPMIEQPNSGVPAARVVIPGS